MQNFRSSLTFILRVITGIFKERISFEKLNSVFNFILHYAKKNSLVSGNQPGENFFITQMVECVSVYIFLISKRNNNNNKKKKTRRQKAKKTKEEKREYL